MPDLTRRRSPSAWRRLLKPRIRRLTARRTPAERYDAYGQIIEIAVHGRAQLAAEHPELLDQ